MTTELERRYRRLLVLYPRPYRREHGDELVATLLDLAAPGQTRPSRPEVVDLVRGGLRQRFRLPLGWSVVVTALLTSVVLGALGAGAGSWLGWRTAPALLNDVALQQLATAAAGQPYGQPIERHDEWRERTQMLSTQEPMFVDAWSVDGARARLAADGWRIEPTHEGTATGGRGETRADGSTTIITMTGRSTMFAATRDGLRLRVDTVTFDGKSIIHAIVWPEQPTAVTPLTVLGLLLGAVGGWLLTGWAGYRLRQRPRASRWAAAALTGAALLALARPTVTTYQRLVDLHIGTADLYPLLPAFSAYVFRTSGTLTIVGLAALTCVLVLTTAVRPDERGPQTVQPAA